MLLVHDDLVDHVLHCVVLTRVSLELVTLIGVLRTLCRRKNGTTVTDWMVYLLIALLSVLG